MPSQSNEDTGSPDAFLRSLVDLLNARDLSIVGRRSSGRQADGVPSSAALPRGPVEGRDVEIALLRPHVRDLMGLCSGRSDGALDEASVRNHERQHLGQLLHDGVVQELTSIGLKLAAVGRRAPPELAASIDQLAQDLAVQQRLLREIVSN